MCFTVNVNIVKEELESRYGSELLDPEKYNPSYYYQAFSFPELPALHLNEKEQLSLYPMKWGLIPYWVSSANEASDIRSLTLNARSETATEKPSFENSFEHRRCIIPVSGFFEWQKYQSQLRPWYIYGKNNNMLSLAGIYDIWTPPVKLGETPLPILSFSILTTRANKLMSEIHNSKFRMPVIISPGKEEEWIRCESNKATEFLQPGADDLLKAHTVNPALASRGFKKNSEEAVKPYNHPEQQTLF